MRLLYELPSLTFAAAGRAQTLFRDLPSTWGSSICHLAGIMWEVTLTPTGATIAPNAAQNVVMQCDIRYHGRLVHQGGFRYLRLLDYLYTGRVRQAENASIATTATGYYRRTWFSGPPKMTGGIDQGGTDFLVPVASIKDGVVEYTFGALADIGAGVTAATSTIRVFAILDLRHDIIIPPAYEVKNQSLAGSDVSLPGYGKIHHLALVANDDVQTAFATTDVLGQVVIQNLRDGEFRTRASAASAAFSILNASGPITGFSAPAITATDVYNRRVDPAAVTALAAGENVVAPILYPPVGAGITDLPTADAPKIQWTGTQGATVATFGRFLAQHPTQSAQILAAAVAELRKKIGKSKVKTESRDAYKGPDAEFMPLKVTLE